ncbi:HEAT repeat domain-containing protein [Haliangium sp.]|uniref:HEAT repeat domain-containing protein n=1 Tax=Haliangium sp. TaxID=2663208 RepID=UPI003D1163C5
MRFHLRRRRGRAGGPLPTGPASPDLALLLVLLLVSALAACAPAAARNARGLLAQGDPVSAEAAADRGLAEDPEHPALWRVKIEAVYAGGDAARALALYREWTARRGEHDHELLRRLATATLDQGLRVPSAPVRAAAVQAIERFEVIELAPAVAARIGDDSELVAAAAAIALLRSAPGAAEAAGQLEHSRDPQVRALILAGLARKLGAPTRPDLLAALADPEPLVRQVALRALADLTDPADVARFAAVAGEDPDPGVRGAAVAGLGALAGAAEARDPAAQAARAALDDAHLAVRSAAVTALARLDDRETLARVAAQPLPALAVRAAMAVRGDQPALLERALDRALADPDPSVRAAALNAVHAAERGRAVTRAEAALADPSWLVRLAAARALLYLDTIERRGDSAPSEDLDTLAGSVTAAQRGRAEDTLAAAIAEAGPRLGLQAAQALADRGDPRGSAAWAAVLTSGADATLRQAAARAWPRHARRTSPDPALTQAIADALADPAPLVRLAAAEALLDR